MDSDNTNNYFSQVVLNRIIPDTCFEEETETIEETSESMQLECEELVSSLVGKVREVLHKEVKAYFSSQLKKRIQEKETEILRQSMDLQRLKEKEMEWLSQSVENIVMRIQPSQTTGRHRETPDEMEIFNREMMDFQFFDHIRFLDTDRDNDDDEKEDADEEITPTVNRLSDEED